MCAVYLYTVRNMIFPFLPQQYLCLSQIYIRIWLDWAPRQRSLWSCFQGKRKTAEQVLCHKDCPLQRVSQVFFFFEWALHSVFMKKNTDAVQNKIKVLLTEPCTCTSLDQKSSTRGGGIIRPSSLQYCSILHVLDGGFRVPMGQYRGQ